MTRVWTPEQRAAKLEKLRKEAERAMARLGAAGVVMVAFWAEGDSGYHMLDGGVSPMPLKDLYVRLQAMHEMMAMSGGKDVKLQ